MKKWGLKIRVPAGLAGFALLFYYLIFIEAIVITGHSGDMVCAGTESDPCFAFINFTAKEDIFLYPMDYDPWGRNTPFETDKGLKSWKMYRSWGKGWREIKLEQTCSGTWCGAPDNKGVKYSFVFREGRDYKIKIVAYKKNPKDDVKWGFGPIDPIWYGKDWIIDSLLTNVIAETGDANFTHLNISSTAPYDSLVGYWSFDGDVEDTLLTTHYDFTENGNDGTGVAQANTTSTCLSNFGNCLQVDGNGDYVSLSAIVTAAPFSVCAWFKSSSEASQTIISFGDTAGDVNVFIVAIRGDLPGDPVIAQLVSTAQNWDHAATTSGYTVNQWHHTCAVYTSSTLREIYLDGGNKGTNTTDSTPAGVDSGAIGRVERASPTAYFNGIIDEVMIFDTALNLGNVTEIYNNQSARFVGTGKQELSNQTHLNISSGNNRVNVTTVFDNLFESNLSLFLQYYNVTGWFSTSAQNLTSGTNSTFTIDSTSTNLTLNFTLIAGPNQTSTFYTPIIYDDIIFDVYAEVVDTCICPGDGNNWEVDMEDMCNLTSACTLGTGNQTWTGSSGYFNCSANLNLTNRDAPPSGTIFYHSLGCEVIRLAILLILSTKMLKRKRIGGEIT